MSNVVIVALPARTEEVFKVSSEKVPHMTLVFLGDAGEVKDLDKILEFVEHASALMDPFWMETDYRGTLGGDEADVLFFDKKWDFKILEKFRNQLLQNKAIRRAYDSAEQYPEFTPHLTLGYPKAPAKETDHEYGLMNVRFDRIAVWTGDYEGPEFRLRHDSDIMGEGESVAPLSMSADVAKALYHYGIKGMKWGVRRAEGGDQAVMPTPGGMKGRVAAAKASVARAQAENKKTTPVTATPGHTSSGKAVVKTSGGRRQPAHEDAIKAATTKQQLHSSGIKSLSNKELKDLAERLNLEAQINRLDAPQMTLGQKATKKFFDNPGQTFKDVDTAINLGTKVVKFAQSKKTRRAVKIAGLLAA